MKIALAKYDRSEPLFIDPVLNYSTYLGGSALGDTGQGIAVDSAGDAFVAGETFSIAFPTTSNAFNKGPLASNANGAIFVTEINPAGTSEIYSTYLAGSGGDFALGITLDPSGNIYVTGATFSTDFPTTSNGLKHGANAGATTGTSYIAKINPTLSGTNSLVYSSYLGGSGGSNPDFGNAIAADANGSAYVVGITAASAGTGLANFPVTTATAFQSSLPNNAGNAFLTRIDTTQSGNASLIYSTYLGGNGANAVSSGLGFADEALGVAVDSANNAYLTGTTTSTNFPTSTTGFKTTAPLAVANGTAFVSRIDTTKTGNASLVYSSYLGGERFDFATAAGLGPNNVAYVTGTTNSLAFPTLPAGAFQTTGSVTGAAFVSLIDTAQTGSTSLKYSTFLGGGGTTGFGIRADAAGNAYVVGGTNSSAFPVTPGAFQPTFAAGAKGEGFLSKLSPAGSGAADLVYSSFFGGSGSASGPDGIHAVAVDSSNNAYITGVTFSSNLPVFPAAAFQKTLPVGSTSAAFIAKLTLIPTLTFSPATLNFGTQLVNTTSAPQIVTVTNNSNAALAITSIAVVAGSPAASGSDYVKASDTCGVSIPAGASCMVGVTFKPSAPPSVESATLIFTDISPQSVSLTGTGSTDFTVTAPATSTVAQGATTTFTVTVAPVGGFNSAVALACTGAPALATCIATPTSVTPADGITPVTSSVMITTTANGLIMPLPPVPAPPLSLWQIVPLVMALIMVFLLPRTQRLRLRLGMVAAMLIFIALAGCSGSGKPGTPKGTTNLTITGTSGALSHSTTVALTVK